MHREIIDSLSNVGRLRRDVEATSRQLQGGRVMMMLGSFLFTAKTLPPQKLQRTTEFRWEYQNRSGGRSPALQFLGMGTDSMELEGTAYPELGGGTQQVQLMRELAGLGKPLPLVDGRGLVYGEWCITRVEETSTVFFDNGMPRRIDFKLHIRRYGEDAA